MQRGGSDWTLAEWNLKKGSMEKRTTKITTAKQNKIKQSTAILLPEPRERQLRRCIPHAGLCFVINVHKKLR